MIRGTFGLLKRGSSSWFYVAVEHGYVPVSESCGLLMIDNDSEKELIGLLRILKNTNDL